MRAGRPLYEPLARSGCRGDALRVAGGLALLSAVALLLLVVSWTGALR